MLMTIEDTREALYKLLQSLGPGWHDREELAKALHKNQLNPVEKGVLDLLVADGRIEKVMQPVGTRNVTRWVYRVRGVM